MRFSLKWALALTAYVAFAAATFSTPNYAFILALWAMSLMAACYASLVALAATGRLRIVAAGFAIASAIAIFFLALQAAGRYRMPWRQLAESQLKIGGSLQSIEGYQRMLRPMRADPNNPNYVTNLPRIESDLRLALRLQSANALSVVVAGTIGAILGAVAYSQANKHVA
jgi:hypothetical protein